MEPACSSSAVALIASMGISLTFATLAKSLELSAEPPEKALLLSDQWRASFPGQLLSFDEFLLGVSTLFP